MKSARPAILLGMLGALGALIWLVAGARAGGGDSKRRHSLQGAIAAADPEMLSARYVLAQADYGGGAQAGPLPALLKERGWLRPGGVPGESPMSWCPATKKGAFFRHGWVWICGESGRVLKSVWFEPDLKAGGALEWSDDGTQLRLRADGWRHFLNLDIEVNPS